MAQSRKTAVDVNVSEIAKLLKDSVTDATSEVLQDVMREVIVRTPVRTGFLRNNWVATVNALPTKLKKNRRRTGRNRPGTFPPVDPQQIASLGVVANGIQPGDVFYFTNNANYAVYVERRRRMIASTVANLDEIVEETFERVQRTLARRAR